jgi:pyrroline-5-carboxylate reductase
MKIRIIGCGAMGGAMAQILALHGRSLSLVDHVLERAEALGAALHCPVFEDPLEGLSPEDFLLIAVKPQDFSKLAETLKEVNCALVISIVTGITTAELKGAFPHSPVLRMMPNLAVQYGEGIAALIEDPDLNHLKTAIEDVFAPLGYLRWFPETLADGVTSLTGSGPAFVFTMVESMVDAAIAMGFSAESGYELVKKMIGGALTTLHESHKVPGELKWRVTSPGGTTIAGLRLFEEKGVRSGILETFLAAYHKSIELSQRERSGQSRN